MGKSIFPGIIIGRPYIENNTVVEIEKYQILDENIEKEIDRFLQAVNKAKEDIKKIKQDLQGKIDKQDLQILFVHLMILDDPQFLNEIKREIEKERCNAEAVVRKISNKYIELFEKLEDELYQQRALDIKDVSERIINILLKKNQEEQKLDGKILVTKELLPSKLLKLYYSGIKIQGIIMEYLGETSHTAILAKALEIPTLMGGKDLLSLEWGDIIILDTTTQNGKIITNPDNLILEKYEQRKNKYKDKIKQIENSIDKDTVTLDGERVRLHLNIGGRLDISEVSKKRPDGIGLLRTELIYMDAKEFPSEDVQRKIYSNLSIEFGSDKPLIIRTLDIGADKQLGYYNMPKEDNPSLGCRGMRFTLSNKEILKTQIKSILRAGIEGNLKMMYPMITTIDELVEISKIVEECKIELETEGKIYKKDLEIGMMIEVPSNVMMVDIFAEYVDFFSIGTNDLTQYILATDRFSSIGEKLYDCYNPAVLRAINTVSQVALRKNKKVSICGEMAGEELAVIALLSFGIRDLSMAPAYVPRVRNLIRKINISELDDIKEKLLNAGTAQQVRDILDKYLVKIEQR